jgi:hypothetical protein
MQGNKGAAGNKKVAASPSKKKGDSGDKVGG